MKHNKALKWIFSRIRPILHIIAFLIIFRCAAAALGIMFAFLSRDVIDSAVSGNMPLLLRYSAVTVLTVIAEAALSYISNYVENRTTASFDRTLKLRLFKSIEEKDYYRISKHHSGDLLTRITDDVSMVSLNAVCVIPDLLSVCLSLVLALISLIRLDPRFGLIFLLGGALFMGAVKLFSRFLKRLHKRVQEAVANGNAFFQESLVNLLMVKVFGIEKEIAAKCADLQNTVVNEKIRRSNIYLLSSAGANLMFNAGGLYALIWSAFRLAAGGISFGTLTAMIQLVNRVQSPVAGLSAFIPKAFSILASAERIIEIEELPAEDPGDKLKNPSGFYSELTEIRFDSVSFAYDRLPVISGADFSVPKGSFVVISGHSGIGKSTLMKLLLGVYKPQSGSISLIAGDRKIPVGKNTRPLFAYVPQGNMILSGTVRDAVKIVAPGASDAEIMEAAKISCALDFIDALPDKLDTEIGENGLGLSEGQIQRLAVTRALLSGAEILLLDEATSALDSETETQLLKNLRTLRGKTCIIISHKPSAFKVCDFALGVSEGRVTINRLKNKS
ncbi:MAG TPA: ABC transporter ATP-binding protein/permease [Candidatus Monoglobus merdigallinarum]|uniref:ABC transporter ATP-binding protein/permease n=1 Tax=Candidatus Monoglobus merdigallinarum TaxID=2838698 RepID=A0A9D1TLL3_9FIRM|nr:ABC transporter ATP-binding protein/permease [Candidatus Monoglobus merdigallinarum]